MKLSEEQFRQQVRARLTKGDAFRLGASAYQARQDAVARELSEMTRDDIVAKYPLYCHKL